MEGLYSSSKMFKLRKGSFENLDLNSPLLRYLCAQSQSQSPSRSPSPMDAMKQRRRHQSPRSPFSPVENLVERSPPSAVYGTPMTAMETEEVLVMDGVLVSGGGPRSSRPGSEISSSSSSSGSSGRNLYKSQFADGKEKLRQTRFPAKNKSEAQICKSYTGTGSCTPSPKSRFGHQIMEYLVTKAAAATTQAALLTAPKSTENTFSTTASCLEWSPQDDGIEVVLPHSSVGKPLSREDISSYINNVLYCLTTRSRLPVFAEVWSEQ